MPAKRDIVKNETPTRRVAPKRALATSGGDGGKQRRVKRDAHDEDDDIDDKTAVNDAARNASGKERDVDVVDDGDNKNAIDADGGDDDGGERGDKSAGGAEQNAPLPNLDALGDLGDLLTHPTPDAPIKVCMCARAYVRAWRVRGCACVCFFT